jgi:hypothetical protein
MRNQQYKLKKGPDLLGCFLEQLNFNQRMQVASYISLIPFLKPPVGSSYPQKNFNNLNNKMEHALNLMMQLL